jgi:hypothetical protein
VEFGQHGFLFERGVMTDLNSLIDPALGWDLQWVFDINDRAKLPDTEFWTASSGRS